ncbi:MAG: ABC transporter ATP-binding protein [Acidobacteriota bacterium]
MDVGAAVVTSQLTKVFARHGGGKTPLSAIDGLDLEVPMGDIFGFLGPNGAGKTTTLRVLTGVLSATSGDARVLGVDVRRTPEKVKALVSYLPQGEVLYGDLTAAENVRFVLSLYGIPRAYREGLARESLELLELSSMADRRAGQLSGGQRRILAVACAVAPRQRLLILDEPTAGLDPEKRALVWDVLHRLQAAGATVFVTTHQMDEADRCRRLGLMSRGRLLASGRPEELRQSFGMKVYEIAYDGPLPAPEHVARALPVAQRSVRGSRLRIVTTIGSADEVARALAGSGIPARSVRASEPDLEDVFLTGSRALGLPA